MERKARLDEEAAKRLAALRESRAEVRKLMKKIRTDKKNELQKRRRLKAKVLATMPLRVLKSLLMCKQATAQPPLREQSEHREAAGTHILCNIKNTKKKSGGVDSRTPEPEAPAV